MLDDALAEDYKYTELGYVKSSLKYGKSSDDPYNILHCITEGKEIYVSNKHKKNTSSKKFIRYGTILVWDYNSAIIAQEKSVANHYLARLICKNARSLEIQSKEKQEKIDSPNKSTT